MTHFGHFANKRDDVPPSTTSCCPPPMYKRSKVMLLNRHSMSYGGGEWVNTVCELDIENHVDLVLRLFDQKSNMR